MSAPRAVSEVSCPGELPLYVHPEWHERFPWLVQGTTGRGEGAEPFDLRMFGDIPSGLLLERWAALQRALGCARAVHAHQVHGARVLVHQGGPAGLLIAEGCDGHATQTAGVLLTVSVADCVPIFLVDPERRAIAALHGGWRGVAAGILESGIEALGRQAGTPPADLYAHFGPAICGACYEVGPEVFRALGLAAPRGLASVDLRRALAERAVAAGLEAERLTISSFCTRCGDTPFFSHRGGCPERQMGVLGLRP